MYDQVKHSEILHSAYTVYLFVLRGSEDTQRLFPYMELSGWFFITEMKCLLRGTTWVLTQVELDL
jgi:hypothetical protein